MLQGAFSSLFFSESLSHSSVSIFLFFSFSLCSCLSVQKRYQTKRSPSLTRETKVLFWNFVLFLDVEIWTDRFRNLGDGNQKPGRIAKVLTEVYHVVRGIPRGTV